jgi:hypothetical protein
VLTAAPEEALLLPVLASELFAAFRAELDAMLAAVTAELVEPELPAPGLPADDPPTVAPPAVPVLAATVPTTALLVEVPLAAPPAVLT